MAEHRVYQQNADGSQSLVSTHADLASAQSKANTAFSAKASFTVIEVQIPGGVTRITTLGTDNTIPVKPA
ncbi:MAG: hypothetical protein KGI54_08910 [Pseudomonadota bacterium]|nr:hypothetical protein [Pseudomonadota bacterium]